MDFLLIFSGKAQQVIPGNPDSIFSAPFKQLNVLQDISAFVHQLKRMIAEALNARLDPPDTGAGQHLDLFFGKSSSRFISSLLFDDNNSVSFAV